MNEKNKIRVLIVDDHAVVREGLAFFAGGREEMEIVGQAEDGISAVEMARTLKPDVVVLDVVMPKMDGIEATKAIKAENPDARVLVLSSFSDEETIFAAINAGVSGYILKESSPKELIQAIGDVFRGETPLHSSVAKIVMRGVKESSELKPGVHSLTERELEVLRLVAQGLSNRDISKALSVSVRTAGVHVTHILDKLNLENRTQAALYALREGIAKNTKK